MYMESYHTLYDNVYYYKKLYYMITETNLEGGETSDNIAVCGEGKALRSILLSAFLLLLLLLGLESTILTTSLQSPPCTSVF